MGTIFVDNIKQQSSQGSGTITIGASGETVALASGVVQSNLITPVFHVQDSAEQVVSDNTVTKVTYGGASIDTDSGWDTSNERWTVPSGKAGKYVITALLNIYSSSALDAGSNYIRVNGTTVQTGYMDVGGSHDYHLSITCSTIKDLSVGDYVEHWGLVNGEPSGTYKFYSDSNILRSFSLYRIGT